MNENLNVEVHQGSGPYLLLVHGMLSSRSHWLPNIAALGEVCKPITIELWGHNRSPAPLNPECYSPQSYVKHIEDIRKRLPTERWFVCGHSLGAALTMRYALEHPENCIGQIFTNSNSAFADQATQASWIESSARSAQTFRRGGLPSLDRLPHHPRHTRRIPADVKNALVADARRHNIEGIALTTEFTSPYSSVRDRVKYNRVPSLFTWGVYEKRFQRHQPYIEAEIPQLEVVECDAGHAVNLQAIDTFNNAVCGFIEKCDASPNDPC